MLGPPGLEVENLDDIYRNSCRIRRMNGMVTTPNIIGKISTIGARNRPCLHKARNEAMPVRPMVWVIILPIMLKPLRITVQH